MRAQVARARDRHPRRAAGVGEPDRPHADVPADHADGRLPLRELVAELRRPEVREAILASSAPRCARTRPLPTRRGSIPLGEQPTTSPTRQSSCRCFRGA
jgi:hypothetical protein